MRTSRLFSTILLPILLLGFAVQAAAQFVTPDMSNATFTRQSGTGTNTCFDTGELLFPGVVLSALTSMNNDLLTARGHGDGTFELEILVGGSWIAIYSADVSSGRVDLNTIPLPISFSPALVDGFRFNGNPPDNCTFHSFDLSMTFTFSGEAIAVPSLSNPGKLAMLLVLLATGVYAGRRWLVS